MEQGGSAEGEPVEIKSPHQVKSRRLLPRLQTRTFRLSSQWCERQRKDFDEYHRSHTAARRTVSRRSVRSRRHWAHQILRSDCERKPEGSEVWQAHDRLTQ